MAAYAALVSLMNNIEQIQSHTRLPINFDQEQSEYILGEVNFVIDFLENYNYLGAGEEMKDLESLIRRAAYAFEDIIETHVVDTIDAHSKAEDMNTTTTPSSRSIFARNERLKKKLLKSKKTAPSMSRKNPTLIFDEIWTLMYMIKQRVMKLKGKKETEDPRPSIPITGPSISYVPAGNSTTVGFENELKRIMERLLADQSSRQVIPIVGMGGIGKTTLAKTAYDKLKGGTHFDFCAWVTISQEYDLKQILLGLLGIGSSQESDMELGQTLHQMLYGRRYLIVLDDMWTVEAWEMVKLFFSDNNNGSRIIVTTRESRVSTCFGSPSLAMRFLDEDQSWNLFCETAFAPKSCPRELEEVGQKIVKNCKGLPLSIVVIGGLLAKSEMKKEYWEYIAQDTKTIINLADDKQCMKILSLSYQNLPIHLKPCFLYLGAFSEDEKIRASILIKLWVAEGILKSNCSKDLEVLGEEYLNDLISRNLIIVDTRRLNGKIKSCMIHDFLRDICMKVAENENFMYAPELFSPHKTEFIRRQRRISVHKSVSNKARVLDTMRQGSMTRTLICTDDLDEELPLQKFRLMKVLNYIDTYNYDSVRYQLRDIFQLVNSRLITLKTVSDPTTSFPSSLRFLWNLQILIVRGIPRGEAAIAPLEIWEMTELRHLEFSWGLYLPDPPFSQQTDGIAIMKKLHTLQHIVDLSDEVVKQIPNIKTLKIYYEPSGELSRKKLERGLKSLGLLKKLESLFLSFQLFVSFQKRAECDLLSNLAFPNSLKKLTLRNSGLQWDDMPIIASIPHLEVLKLICDAFIGSNWVLDEEVFHCLKHLKISDCSDLVQWIADDTHFPRLEQLHLGSLKKLVEIPSGIGEINTLQKIELSFCSKSAVISAKKILKEQEEVGNVGLQVTVFCSKYADIESLAGDNFQVHTSEY